MAAVAALALGCAAALPARAQAPAASSDAGQAGCEFRKLTDMTVDMSHGIPRVPIDVNGQRRWVELNTKEPYSTLRKSDIEALGGARRPDPPIVKTTGDHMWHSVKLFQLRNVVLGQVFRMSTWDVAMKDDGPASDVAGFIGLNMLTKADVEFDLAHNRITFFTARNCGDSSLAYWGGPIDQVPLLKPANPLIDHFFHPAIFLNGRIGHAVLDTTSVISTVTSDFAESEGLKAGAPEVQPITGYSKPLLAAKFASFAIGGEKIVNPTLTVVDMKFGNDHTAYQDLRKTPELAPLPRTTSPVMILGLDFLRSHRVLLATSQNRMYFSYNGGPVFQTPRSK